MGSHQIWWNNVEIENLIRYTGLAVGLKPSANQGKARLRGLYRIIYSKSISPPEAKMERSRNPVKGLACLRTAINPVYCTIRRAYGD
jgi:hypothetical protein